MALTVKPSEGVEEVTDMEQSCQDEAETAQRDKD